jgi:hypothetical protein
MGEATGPLPAMTGTAALTAATERAVAEIRCAQELYRELLRGGTLIPVEAVELSGRLADLDRYLRTTAMWAVTDPILSAAPELAAVPAHHRHRKGRTPRQRIPGERILMRAVEVIVPVAAASWAALRGLRHAAHAGTVAAAGGGGTLILAAAVTVGVVHHPGIARPSTASVSASAVPAWYGSATPITSLQSGAPVTHGRADSRSSGIVATLPPAWYATLAPSPSATPTPSPSAAAGVLSAGTTTADLSSGAPVTVTLSASGAPVQWSAWCDPGIDVTLSAAEGTASPGAPSYLVLSVPADEGVPTAICHIWPGGLRILVLLPTAPAPAPSAIVTPSGTPSPDPTSS